LFKLHCQRKKITPMVTKALIRTWKATAPMFRFTFALLQCLAQSHRLLAERNAVSAFPQTPTAN